MLVTGDDHGCLIFWNMITYSQCCRPLRLKERMMCGDFNSDGSMLVCNAVTKKRELVAINTTSLETIILISATIPFLELRLLTWSNAVLFEQGTNWDL
jgi:hypothetical protein